MILSRIALLFFITATVSGCSFVGLGGEDDAQPASQADKSAPKAFTVAYAAECAFEADEREGPWTPAPKRDSGCEELALNLSESTPGQLPTPNGSDAPFETFSTPPIPGSGNVPDPGTRREFPNVSYAQMAGDAIFVLPAPPLPAEGGNDGKQKAQKAQTPSPPLIVDLTIASEPTNPKQAAKNKQQQANQEADSDKLPAGVLWRWEAPEDPVQHYFKVTPNLEPLAASPERTITGEPTGRIQLLAVFTGLGIEDHKTMYVLDTIDVSKAETVRRINLTETEPTLEFRMADGLLQVAPDGTPRTNPDGWTSIWVGDDGLIVRTAGFGGRDRPFDFLLQNLVVLKPQVDEFQNVKVYGYPAGYRPPADAQPTEGEGEPAFPVEDALWLLETSGQFFTTDDDTRLWGYIGDAIAEVDPESGDQVAIYNFDKPLVPGGSVAGAFRSDRFVAFINGAQQLNVVSLGWDGQGGYSVLNRLGDAILLQEKEEYEASIEADACHGLPFADRVTSCRDSVTDSEVQDWKASQNKKLSEQNDGS